MAKDKVVIPDLNIKMAAGKTKKDDKPERLTIASPLLTEEMTEVSKGYKGKVINVVDTAIATAQEIESLNAELGGLEKVLKTEAGTAKDKEIKAGNFVKTVDVTGSQMKIQIQFRDSYSKMDITMKDPLKQIFGDKFEIMFEVTEIETLRNEKKPELKALLGTRYEDFFNIDRSVKPTNEFQHNYFALRKSLKPEQLATVEKVQAACMSSPAVKYPK